MVPSLFGLWINDRFLPRQCNSLDQGLSVGVVFLGLSLRHVILER